MCNAHRNPALFVPRPAEVIALGIAMDEWRRSRNRPEIIWSSGALSVRLTTDRHLIASVGPLTLYAVQVTARSNYIEARAAAIAVAQALRPKVEARSRMLAHYRYPVSSSTVKRQARLFLLDWKTDIHELYDRFDPLERAMEPGEERAILANISQALANTIF
jgi:hypothetical protein